MPVCRKPALCFGDVARAGWRGSARMATVDFRNLPLYVDLLAVAGTGDAVAALQALDRLEVPLAQAGPGRLLGETWAVEVRRWSERLLFHHSCLGEPDAQRWNLAAGDDEIRMRAVDQAIEALRVAADMGAPFYSVHGGWALKLTRDEDNQPVGDTITPLRTQDQLCRSLDRLAMQADALGLQVLVETAPFVPAERPAFAEPEQMRALLERIAAPSLALLLDLPAMMLTARRMREEPETVLEYLRPWIGAQELHHGDGKGLRHLPLRENDLELSLARLAGGLAKPVVLTMRDLDGPALRDQIALALEVLAPPPPPAPPPPADRSDTTDAESDEA